MTHALIAANRRRRSIRRWMFIATLPLTLAALLVVGKVLSMYAFAHQSITSYVLDDYAGATSAAHGQEFVNWFEPYKAPYNVGVGLAASEQLPEARAKFERALPLAPGLEACAVWVNLALVVERQGDAAVAAGDGAAGMEFYAEALMIAAETPPECESPEADEQSPDPERSLADTLDDLVDRLQEKQQQKSPPEQSEQPEPQEQPSESQLEELQKKLEQGSEERDQRGGDEEGPGGGTDKPW